MSKSKPTLTQRQKRAKDKYEAGEELTESERLDLCSIPPAYYSN